MDKGTGGMLIAAFLLLILGVSAFTTTIASEEQKLVQKTIVDSELFDTTDARADGLQINESDTDSNHTLAQAPTGWKQHDSDCDTITVISVGNSTTAFTLDTDYEVLGTYGEIIHILNTTATENSANSTYVDYSYCGDDYLSESWTRSVANLIVGFFSIALMAVSVGLFWQIMKKEGLLNI
jgi:hypothetical protein